MCRSVLASGELGSHHGLPVTIVVATTLQELQSAAGTARAGDTWLPMGDVIRMASHAHHYLAVFDQHTNRTLYLAHTKRIANADQRIVLHAKDRGCSYPGCTVPGYLAEVHHVAPWARTHRTHIDDLALGCGPHHKLHEQGWTTRKRHNGTTEWIPPPHSPASGRCPHDGQPRTNNYWHPQRYLHKDQDDEHE